MPEAPAAAPPSSTVREVRIINSGPPKPPPAPTREIRAADIANLPGEVRPRPGAPAAEAPDNRTSLRKNLESKSKPIGQPTTVPTPVKETPSKPAAAEKPAAEPAVEPETPPVEQPAGQPTAPTAPADKKKANPWKLYDEEKKARAASEAEIQRLKTSIVPDQERTAIMERVTKAEARAKELEDHIRFVSYEQSTEFKEQYQAPYEAAWKRATKELSEITINGQDGQPRAVTSQDILDLVNMPLGAARDVADQVFGRFADDVMAHRKEIRGLFDKQNDALESAKKNGGIRQKQQQEHLQKQHAEVTAFVQGEWKKAVDEFAADPVNGAFFKPKAIAEGAEPTPEEKEWNDALERGFKLVDDAWGSNAMDAKLTPEQRAAVIKKNVAVRNRAAAFGPMKKMVSRLNSKIAQLEKDLAEYSGSTPGAGGSTPNGQVQVASTGIGAFKDRLRKIAH